MSTNDKFLIVKNIKSFLIDLEKLTLNFPKKDFISRSIMYNTSLDVLELVLKANYESDKNIRNNYQISALAKINMIDFYLERAYKLGYISEKQLKNKASSILKINKMLYGWYKNA